MIVTIKVRSVLAVFFKLVIFISTVSFSVIYSIHGIFFISIINSIRALTKISVVEKRSFIIFN